MTIETWEWAVWIFVAGMCAGWWLSGTLRVRPLRRLKGGGEN